MVSLKGEQVAGLNFVWRHLTFRKEFLADFQEFSELHRLHVADGNMSEDVGRGKVKLKVIVDKEYRVIDLMIPEYVPKIKKNRLLVIAAQDRNENSWFTSNLTVNKRKNLFKKSRTDEKIHKTFSDRLLTENQMQMF